MKVAKSMSPKLGYIARRAVQTAWLPGARRSQPEPVLVLSRNGTRDFPSDSEIWGGKMILFVCFSQEVLLVVGYSDRTAAAPGPCMQQGRLLKIQHHSRCRWEQPPA